MKIGEPLNVVYCKKHRMGTHRYLQELLYFWSHNQKI